jgi:hypothetical protein
MVHAPSSAATVWVSLCVPGAGVTMPDVENGAGKGVAPSTTACANVANWCGCDAVQCSVTESPAW